MAKDVVSFLAWASEPEHDERQKKGLKFMIIATGLVAVTFFYKRHRWAYIKTKKIIYKPPKFKDL